MIRRFGKPSAGILGIGQAFFADNDEYLARSREHARVYTRQPRRTRCKICDGPLPEAPAFRKGGVPYASCARCGHLNGLHEDTDEFHEAIYGDERYGEYYGSPDAAAYQRRVDAIYAPKVEFLREVLTAEGHDPRRFAFADVGAGSGYFVAALAQAGLDRCRGYELTEYQAAYANRMIPGDRISVIDRADPIDYLRRIDADVVSLIGVLEHMQRPRAALAALRDNPRVRYLLVVAPLFSLCVFLEMVFPRAYPRHLVSDHTHLFTPSSLAWIEQEFGLGRAGEWWFGSDMIDLLRHVSVTLAGDPDTAAMAGPWQALMRPLIDPLQLQLDERGAPSECHLVLEVRRGG